MTKGWRNESQRHSLARRGVKTATTKDKVLNKVPVKLSPKDEKRIEVKNPDVIQGRELELYYENNEPLYRIQQSWWKNFNRRKSKGTFDRSLAVKGIRDNFIPLVVTSYNKELGNVGRVDFATKHYLADRFVDEYEEESSLGNI